MTESDFSGQSPEELKVLGQKGTIILATPKGAAALDEAIKILSQQLGDYGPSIREYTEGNRNLDDPSHSSMLKTFYNISKMRSDLLNERQRVVLYSEPQDLNFVRFGSTFIREFYDPRRGLIVARYTLAGTLEQRYLNEGAQTHVKYISYNSPFGDAVWDQPLPSKVKFLANGIHLEANIRALPLNRCKDLTI